MIQVYLFFVNDEKKAMRDRVILSLWEKEEVGTEELKEVLQKNNEMRITCSDLQLIKYINSLGYFRKKDILANGIR